MNMQHDARGIKPFPATAFGDAGIDEAIDSLLVFADFSCRLRVSVPAEAIVMDGGIIRMIPEQTVDSRTEPSSQNTVLHTKIEQQNFNRSQFTPNLGEITVA
jgi:hypothetical protein